MFDNNDWLTIGTGLDFERPELHIALYTLILIFSSDKSLGIKDGVGRVSRGLVFSRISDQSIGLVEGNIGGSGVESLLVGNNLEAMLFIVPYCNAGVGGSEIDPDSYFVSD